MPIIGIYFRAEKHGRDLYLNLAIRWSRHGERGLSSVDSLQV